MSLLLLWNSQIAAPARVVVARARGLTFGVPARSLSVAGRARTITVLVVAR